MEERVAILNILVKMPPVENKLPVIVKTGAGILFLGNATTHHDAESLGISASISCNKISRAQIKGSDRVFFLLH